MTLVRTRTIVMISRSGAVRIAGTEEAVQLVYTVRSTCKRARAAGSCFETQQTASSGIGNGRIARHLRIIVEKEFRSAFISPRSALSPKPAP